MKKIIQICKQAVIGSVLFTGAVTLVAFCVFELFKN